jgi:FAD/FMN-containing dehydrogenase
MTDLIVITPSDPEYNELRLNWDTRFQFFPRKILQALNERGVQQALTIIQKKKIPYAIRAGKHCFEPWSLTNGYLLDVSPINHIRLHGKNAYIGAGATLGNIYNILLSEGRAIPAGTRPTVGIGGQGQNGGIGYSTRLHGLLTDNILAYRVVLADGKIVTASSEEHSDLYWALRGCGAGNFGVVVEYVVKTFRATKVTVFTYNYSFDEDGKEALEWLTSVQNGTELTAQGLIHKSGIKITGQFFGRPEELFEMLDDLPLPETSDIRYVPFSEAIAYFSAPTPKESVKAKSRFFSQPLTSSVIDSLIKSVRELDLDPRARYTIGLQQLRGTAEGSMPWKNSTYWIDWALRWTEGPEPEPEVLEQSYLDTLDISDDWAYMGMMDVDVAPPNYRKAYYGDRENRKKLKEIKAKYDPTSFFVYPQGLVQRSEDSE